MNLEIKTYIKRDKDFIIKDIAEDNESLFVSIDEIQKLDKNKLDYDYLDGALIIEYQGNKLLDFEHWDLINQLLAYFVDALADLSNQEEAKFSFPDQPFSVTLKNKGADYLSVDFNDIKATIPRMEFIISILEASEKFYHQLAKLFPEYASDISYYQTKVSDVKEIYNL